jgi:hypothetical protein
VIAVGLVGEALIASFGTHLGNRFAGNFALDWAVAGGIALGAGALTAAASDNASGAILLSAAVVQVVALVLVERAKGRRRPGPRSKSWWKSHAHARDALTIALAISPPGSPARTASATDAARAVSESGCSPSLVSCSKTRRATQTDPADSNSRVRPTIHLAAIDSPLAAPHAGGARRRIGAAALGVPSVIFWGWVCNAVSEGTGCDAWNVVAGLSLAGAAVGAGVGALIGSGVVRWELRYAQPRGSAHWRPRGDGDLRVGVRLRIP